jgi:hypothetical protein
VILIEVGGLLRVEAAGRAGVGDFGLGVETGALHVSLSIGVARRERAVRFAEGGHEARNFEVVAEAGVGLHVVGRAVVVIIAEIRSPVSRFLALRAVDLGKASGLEDFAVNREVSGGSSGAHIYDLCCILRMKFWVEKS